MEDLEKEMDLLLAQEKEQERASNRSHRIAVRRLSRPADEPKQDVPAEEVDNPPASTTAPSASTPSSPKTRSPPAAKRQRQNPSGVQGETEAGTSSLGASSMMHLCPPRRVTFSQPRPPARKPVQPPKPASSLKRQRAPPELNEHSSRSPTSSSSSDELPILLRQRTNVAGAASQDPLLQGAEFPSAAEREQARLRVAASVAASRSSLAALSAHRPTASPSSPPPLPLRVTPGPAPSTSTPSSAAGTGAGASLGAPLATAPTGEREKSKP